MRFRYPLAHTCRSVGYALVAGTILAACAGAPPPVPTPTPPAGASIRTCPPGVTRQDRPDLPRRVRVENQTTDTLELWLDRCYWYSHLGEVAPGAVIVPELEGRIVLFDEGLRFQAFDGRRQLHVGTFVLPVRDHAPAGTASGPLPTLILSEASARERGTLTTYLLDESAAAGEGAAPVITSEGSDGSYTAVFAERSGAILSWSCTEDEERHLVLSTAGPLGGETVQVRSRVGLETRGTDFASEGRWRIQKGFTDAAVAPDEVVERLTRDALEAGRIELVIEEDTGSMQAHGFVTEGVEEALAGGCWARR